MKGLFIIIGESFRSGGQHSRDRGNPISYDDQINACQSHIIFFDYIMKKFHIDIQIVISTYRTQYDKIITNIYKPYLKKANIYAKPIGLQSLFNRSIPKDLTNYDFVFYFRIDIYLKNNFLKVFNPNSQKILYLCPCWKKGSIIKDGHPRVSDVMVFFPKKYFNYLDKIKIYHDSWFNLIKNNGLDYTDLDMMVNTYHDSNTSRDYNPYFRIVNRPEGKKMHSLNYHFDKRDFNQHFNKIPTVSYFDLINVLSVNHNKEETGKFFHFNSDEIISLPLKQTIINLTTNKIDEIIIWNYNNGGIKGNYHGRYIKSSTINDFRVNDKLKFVLIDKNIISRFSGIQIKVLSTFHENKNNPDDKYFNFDCNLYLSKKSDVIIINSRTNLNKDGIIWNYNSGSINGKYHGRYNYYNKDDFRKNDIIYIFFKNKIINL